METAITFILGVLLRIGIPVAVTTLIFFLLRRLDEGWQKEALQIPVKSTLKPCWEFKGCPEGKQKDCPVASQPEIPCWQVFRTKKGLLREECLGCEIFHAAPTPAK